MSAEPVARAARRLPALGREARRAVLGHLRRGDVRAEPCARHGRAAVTQMPWPTDHDRFAKCFALRGHDAPFRDCNCGWAAYYGSPRSPSCPRSSASGARSSRGARSSSARPAFAPSSRGRCAAGPPPPRRHPRARPAPDNAAEAYAIPLCRATSCSRTPAWHGEVRVLGLMRRCRPPDRARIAAARGLRRRALDLREVAGLDAQRPQQFGQLLLLAVVERGEPERVGVQQHRRALGDVAALGGDLRERRAAVGLVRDAAHEPVLLELVDDVRDARAVHLQALADLAERQRAGRVNDRSMSAS